MRGSAAWISAIALLGCTTVACADTISYTQAISGQTGSLTGNNVTFDMPDFNPALGTLTGITLSFTGTATDEVLFEEGAPPGGPFAALNTARLSGVGLSYFTPYSLATSMFDLAPGAPGGFSTMFDAGFTASVSSAALSGYETGLPPGFEVTGLTLGFRLLNSSGNPVYPSDGETSFNYNLLETYAYTPLPEPGSAPLALSGVAALVVMRTRLMRWWSRHR